MLYKLINKVTIIYETTIEANSEREARELASDNGIRNAEKDQYWETGWKVIRKNDEGGKVIAKIKYDLNKGTVTVTRKGEKPVNV